MGGRWTNRKNEEHTQVKSTYQEMVKKSPIALKRYKVWRELEKFDKELCY